VNLTFDEAHLASELAKISAPLRVVFAAACAERLLPAYARFSLRTGRGDLPKLRGLLSRLWEDLAGAPMTAREIQSSIDAALQLTPTEDDGPWVPEQAAAEDAGAATAYALRCRQNGKGQEAAWAARRAYEAVDQLVIQHDGLNMNAPGAEARVLDHPLVQDELQCQKRDLLELLGAKRKTPEQVLAPIRSRAAAEAQRRAAR
jgi:uncharacterized protein YjaG (DUF416 family)